MDNRGRRDSTEDGEFDGINGVDHYNGEAFEQSSSMDGSGPSSSVSGQNRATRSELGITQRLTEILVNEGDGDLLIQQTDREDRLLEWLQAMDMQVMGACRSDERLKPLLKMNVSNGVAEDRLLAQLSQHFEPVEVGILARCFCIPLVSVRVGKIDKQGTRMCPTSNRGNLNLAILPTSDLRLSFVGDDGHVEMIFTLSRKSQCYAVAINEMKEDSSGRSFLIRIPDRTFYFWCSEKSKLLGIELVAKMKDLLERKPSIAELSGISKSRLDCFATHLRAFLMGNNIASSDSAFPSCPEDAQNGDEISRNSSSTSKFVRSRHVGSQASRATTPYQGSLSPRPSSFKEGQPRNLASFRSAAREKVRRRGDGHQSAVDYLVDDSTILKDATGNNLNLEKQPEVSTNCGISDSFFLQLPGKLGIPPLGSAVQLPSSIPTFLSPYYCWSPPGASSVSYSATSPPSLPLYSESSSLPPLASLLPSSSTTNLLRPCPPLSLADVTSMTFPSFLPDPLVRLPVPVTQQIPTFIPLMCDPIVHIPVIDVCSSGQGYLVSAGPAMSTSLPPLHSKLVNPLIPETDSMVEKGARETLRLLISGSTQANQQIFDVLPNVLTRADEVVTGSRGLYSGTSDINVVTNSIAAMGFVSFPCLTKVDGDAQVCARFQFSNERARKSSSRSDDDFSDDEHAGGTLEPNNQCSSS